MRLVAVTNYFESHRGGVEIVAGALARGLTERGLDVRWLAAACDPPPAEGRFQSKPLSVWNIAERRLGVPFPLLSPSAIFKILREVKSADVVLLHDSLCMPSVCARLAAKLFSKPVLIVQHIGAIAYRNIFLCTLMKVGDRLVARPMLRSADQVVFISDATRAFYSDLAFRRSPQLIFNGVDAAIFHAGKPSEPDQSRGSPKTSPTALFVGRFVEKKGLDIVRRVAELRPDVSWVLAGWGPIVPEDWRLPNVQVVRDRSGAGLADLYRSSDVLVLPSYGEGFPLVIQEALACGLPVVCGAETIAADPLAGPWLEGVAVAGDLALGAQALSTAIDRVLKRGRSADGERSAFAQSRYSWSEAAARYVALCTELALKDRRLAAPFSADTASLAEGS